MKNENFTDVKQINYKTTNIRSTTNNTSKKHEFEVNYEGNEQDISREKSSLLVFLLVC